ncbi:hypothetical protein SAMN05446934_2833 [Paraburkholderia hospita]|nr:hypothetical protein SAMN05446934_2833 [Paraburkholderia hospita]
MMLSSDSYPNKASSSLDAEHGNRQPSIVMLTCKATRATSNTSARCQIDVLPSCTSAGINLTEENSRAD